MIARQPVPAGARHGRDTSLHQQGGMTFISLLIVLAGVALIGLGVFRLIPVYLAQMKIVGAMESVKKEYAGDSPTPRQLQQSLAKRFDIEMITAIRYRDISLSRQGDGILMKADYANEVPFIGNVHFIVRFDHQVTVPTSN